MINETQSMALNEAIFLTLGIFIYALQITGWVIFLMIAESKQIFRLKWHVLTLIPGAIILYCIFLGFSKNKSKSIW